jgi:hypothetical protein
VLLATSQLRALAQDQSSSGRSDPVVIQSDAQVNAGEDIVFHIRRPLNKVWVCSGMRW